MSQCSPINSSGCGLRYQRTFFQAPTERTLFLISGCSNTITENSSRHQGPEFIEEDTPGQFRRVRLTCWPKSSGFEVLQKEIGLDLSDLGTKGNLDEIGLLATKTPMLPLPIPDSETAYCSPCGEMFTGTPQHLRSNLKRHMRTSRRHSTRALLKCPESGCKSTLIRTDSLAKHLMTQHGVSRSLDRQDPDKRIRRVRSWKYEWENLQIH